MKVVQAKPVVPLGTTQPARQAANEIIRAYLALARQNEDAIISDVDAEFLHNYRVSLRRVRSVLSLFRDVYSPDQTAELKRFFSGAMDATGRLRDLDVKLSSKQQFFSMLPEYLHLGLVELFSNFHEERMIEKQRVARRLRSVTYQSEMTEIEKLFSGSPGPRPGVNAQRGAYEFACTLIWKRYKKVCKVARGITPETPDAAIHKLRIDCKKLRYLMELFGPLFDASEFRKLLKPLKKLQDNLGRFNDCAVQQNALLHMIANKSDSAGQVNAQLGMAIGGLTTALAQQQEAERDKVMEKFSSFDSAKSRKRFRCMFHQRGKADL